VQSAMDVGEVFEEHRGGFTVQPSEVRSQATPIVDVPPPAR
jgi:hypothetical protein